MKTGPRGGLITASATIFSQDVIVTALAMVGNLILARWLGPVVLGLFYILNLIPSYSEKFGRLGMIDHAAIFFLGRKKYDRSLIFGTVSWISLAMSFLPLLLVFVFRRPLEVSFLKGQPVPLGAFIWVIASVPLVFLYVSWNKLCIGFHQIGVYAFAQLSKSVVFILAAFVFWRVGGGISAVCFAGFASLLIACLISAVGLVSDTKPSFQLSKGLLKDLFGYGWKMYVVTIVTFLHQRSDLLLVAYYCAPSEVSYYSLAATAAQILWKAPNAVSSLLYVRVSAESSEQGAATTAKICRVTIWLLIAGAICGVVLAYPFIRFFYGKVYMPVYQPFVFLLPGVCAFGIARLLIEHFYGSAHPSWVLNVNTVTFVINLFLNLLLIPAYGIAGAALVSTVTYTINMLLLLTLFCRESHLKMGEVLAFRWDDWKDFWARSLSYLRKTSDPATVSPL